MKKVVAKHQCRWRVVKEFGADQGRLGQTIWAGLLCVLDGHAPGAAIAEQAPKGVLIVGSGDDQYLADPCQHQGAERVVDHRFVIHRHQLLAHRRGERRQARATAPSQDDAPTLHQVGLTIANSISAWTPHLYKQHFRHRYAPRGGLFYR